MPRIWPFAVERLHRQESFLSFWWRRALVVLAVSLGMLACEHFGFLYQWEMASLDMFLRHKTSSPSNFVRIVEITDDDYDTLFCQRSPLKAATLLQLIQAVARGEPSVIAVDLDVEHPEEITKAIDSKVPIIWAQVTEPVKEGDREVSLKQGPAHAATGGVVLFPVDRDGVVRRYMRWVKVSGKDLPTLPWAAFKLADPIGAERNESKRPGEELIFNFTGDRYNFIITDAAGVLGATAPCAQPPRRSSASARPPLNTPEVFKDKIVLIGGNFAAAHDSYMTPMGERAGVELMAYAIESEIRGGGFSEAHPWLSFAFDLLVGNALLSFYFWWRPRYPVSFGIAAGLLLSFLVSLIAFASFAYWLSFIPVVVGVTVHELHDELEEAEKLRAENRRLEEEIKALATRHAPPAIPE